MWREEWAVKMAEISLTNHSMTTLRKLKERTKPSFKSVDPPAMPYALSNTRGKRAVSERVAVDGVRKGEMLETDRGNRPSRARRLAARRQSQAEQLFDAFGGNETSSTTTTTRRRRRRRGSLVGEAAKLERSTHKKKKVLSSTRNSTKRGTRTKTKTKDNVDLNDEKSHRYLRRGPPPPPGVDRNPNCEWCGASSGATLVGCSTCHRCFCFKCFQRRPGCGINNWSRAIKDLEYVCQYCKEARPRPSPLVLGPHQQEKDKKKSVLLKKPGSSVVLPSNVGKRSPQPRGPTGRFLSFQKENRKPPPLLESKNDTADSKARASDFVITKRRGRAN